MTDFSHHPVLLSETLAGLNIQADGYYIDATFGRGGHARAILAQLGPLGRLLVVDQDAEAIAAATTQFAADSRVIIQQGRFSRLQSWVAALGWQGQVQGILLDLGVSSPQLDNAQRGFGFMREGPLDMRMDQSCGISAAQWLAQVKETTLADVLHQYGEERFAKRIAKAIIAARQQQAILSTTQLAAIIAAANPHWEASKHPATRSFQAIRICLNQELEEIRQVLAIALDLLSANGRLCVISFHSLEDRLVKRFAQQQAKGDDFPPDLPVRQDQLHPRLRIVGKWRAQTHELALNPRARSATLRVMESLG